MQAFPTALIHNYSENAFNEMALHIFKFQLQQCNIYAEYVKHLPINTDHIKHYTEIPFLPIQFFKSHCVLNTHKKAAEIFTSSGTTQNQSAKHYVAELSLYEKSYLKAFEQFYGQASDYCILALLPSYLDRKGSSLIYMVDHLIRETAHPESGFYLRNHAELFGKLETLKASKQKTLLIGVSFALLDFIANYKIDFPELIVMETGGMKGQRKEIIRTELHEALCEGFGINQIHAEYGMTELLSQAYSKGGGLFTCPNWMKVLIRDPNDPLCLLENGKSGVINVIDFANVHSCSFIATQDLGKLNSQNEFEVLGRFDTAEVRGCNLMIQ